MSWLTKFQQYLSRNSSFQVLCEKRYRFSSISQPILTCEVSSFVWQTLPFFLCLPVNIYSFKVNNEDSKNLS